MAGNGEGRIEDSQCNSLFNSNVAQDPTTNDVSKIDALSFPNENVQYFCSTVNGGMDVFEQSVENQYANCPPKAEGSLGPDGGPREKKAISTVYLTGPSDEASVHCGFEGTSPISYTSPSDSRNSSLVPSKDIFTPGFCVQIRSEAPASLTSEPPLRVASPQSSDLIDLSTPLSENYQEIDSIYSSLSDNRNLTDFNGDSLYQNLPYPATSSAKDDYGDQSYTNFVTAPSSVVQGISLSDFQGTNQETFGVDTQADPVSGSRSGGRQAVADAAHSPYEMPMATVKTHRLPAFYDEPREASSGETVVPLSLADSKERPDPPLKPLSRSDENVGRLANTPNIAPLVPVQLKARPILAPEDLRTPSDVCSVFSLENNGQAETACGRINELLSTTGALNHVQELQKFGEEKYEDTDSGVIKILTQNSGKENNPLVEIRPYNKRKTSDENIQCSDDEKVHTKNGSSVGNKSSRRDNNNETASETSGNGEKLSEIYEKLIAERQILKELSYRKNKDNYDMVYADVTNPSGSPEHRSLPTEPSRSDSRRDSEWKTPKTVQALRTKRAEALPMEDGLSDGSDAAVSKSIREQGVEALMAAVEQLDKTVDHLCELSADHDYSGRDFNKNKPLTKPECDTEKRPPVANDSLREFSAVHELCQASTSNKSRSRPDELEPFESPLIQLEEKEKYEAYALHEAINENCNFPTTSNEKVKERSLKRNELSDSQSSLESPPSSSSNLDEGEKDNCSISMEDSVARRDDTESSMSSDHNDDQGLVSAVTSAVRRSLRRVKRFRNSFGKSRKSTSVDREVRSEERSTEDSEELDERRRLPSDPRVGLPSVRSLSTSAVLLPSIVASLAPPDATGPKISSPRETLTPLSDSPSLRRDAPRSGPDSFRSPPPLSPARHIPANLSSSSFRSTNSGRTSPALHTPENNGHRSLCTSPINSPHSNLSTSNTLPNNQRRSRNLLNLTNSFSSQNDASVSLFPVGQPEPNTRPSSHNRSSSAPDRDSSQPSRSPYPSSQTDITAVLVPRLRLASRNPSPVRRPTSSGGRAASPRRTPRHPDEPTDGRRSRTPQRTAGRRDRGHNRRHSRSSTVPASPASSSSSGRSAGRGVSTNPSATDSRGANSRPLSGTCADNASRRSSATGSDGRAPETSSSQSQRADRAPRRRQRPPPAVTCSEDQDVWPHHHSGLMASLAVTVTVFNISRFAVLGASFGWPFLVQWLLISLVLGVPLLTLHVALGQHTGLGALQLWKVAPIFQGVGVSLVLAQLVLGVYCSVPIAWLSAYLRDSFFFYTDQDAFSWTSCRKLYPGVACSSEANLSAVLPMSVPRYLSWYVQQRTVSSSSTWQESLGSLKFSLTFNVVLIWLLTFVALCKGNRVYGKVSYVIFILPLLCFLAVCVYIASWTREDLSLIPDFARAFMNSKSWVAASREVFLVWGLHGPVLQQMTVHNRRGQSIKSHLWLLVLTTVLVLVLASVTGSCCAASFSHIGLKYSPSSFEKPETAQFLVPIRDPNASFDFDGSQADVRTSSNALAPHGALWEDMYNARGDRDSTSSTDDGLIHVLYDKLFFLASQLMVSHMRYDSLYVGIRISFPQLGTLYGLLYDNMLSMEKPDHLTHGPWKRPTTPEWGRSPLFRKSRVHDKSRSGYQSLRLATELFPAFVGVHGAQQIPPVWATLFYLSLLLLGIAQQLAVWRTLVEIVISSTGLQRKRSLVTACCCLVGLSASLPLASQLGPDLLYFLDYVIGCAWWLMILQLVQVFAILFVRGKPVSAQDIVASIGGGSHASRVPGWSVHVSAFACSILVPVGLLVLSISSFKSGQYREVFTWSSNGYWPVWASQIASGLQLLPILLVPLVALAQTCRFLANTRYDLFQRIQLLYRPVFVPRMHPRPPTPPLSPTQRRQDVEAGETDTNYSPTAESTAPYSDPPPKYTPPPSYSTATGMGIAKALNQNVRRSIRRLRSSLHPSSSSRAEQPRDTPQIWSTQVPNTPLPDTGQTSLGVLETPSILEPYIPPVDYLSETNNDTNDPPPIYSTLDPLSRQKVLSVLQRAGIRRSINSGLRSSRRRQQHSDRNVLVAPQQQTTIELQGLDHLAYDHEIV